MDNVAVLNRLVAAYNDDHAAGVVAEGADDVEYLIPDRGVHVVGREQWLELVELVARGAPGRRMTVVTLVASGDVAALEWVIEGTSSGHVPGFPPAGEPVRRQGCSVIRFREGRIVRWRDYLDNS